MTEPARKLPPFVPAFHALLEDERLRPQDIVVALWIRRFQGANDHAWPGLLTLAARTKLSRSGVQRSIARLEAARWLEVSRAPHRLNHYRFLDSPDLRVTLTHKQDAPSPCVTLTPACVNLTPVIAGQGGAEIRLERVIAEEGRDKSYPPIPPQTANDGNDSLSHILQNLNFPKPVSKKHLNPETPQSEIRDGYLELLIEKLYGRDWERDKLDSRCWMNFLKKLTGLVNAGELPKDRVLGIAGEVRDLERERRGTPLRIRSKGAFFRQSLIEGGLWTEDDTPTKGIPARVAVGDTVCPA